MNLLFLIVISESLIELREKSGYPLDNIPFGIYSHRGSVEDKKPATRIGIIWVNLGDWIIDLQLLEKNNKFDGPLFTSL